jgi:hypothetical protein
MVSGIVLFLQREGEEIEKRTGDDGRMLDGDAGELLPDLVFTALPVPCFESLDDALGGVLRGQLAPRGWERSSVVPRVRVFALAWIAPFAQLLAIVAAPAIMVAKLRV